MADRRPVGLQVAAHGIVVAELHQRGRRQPIRLVHTDTALERWGYNVPVLSCSLLTTDEPQDATSFLDGFLPEGQARSDLAAARDLVAADTWMMLVEYGRDIAGAMIIGDGTGATRTRPATAEPYDADGLAAAVAALPTHPLGSHDDSELSLAGLQQKLLLVAADDGWARPIGGRPSTHILKPEPPEHPGLVDLEAEALLLARAVGLTSITPQWIDVGGRPCLVVERYDRHPGDPVQRIHQEDLCQATGRDPRANGGRGKYERSGGPGFRDAALLLRRHAEDADAQLEQLTGAMVFTVLIGNSDAHAKNLSFLLDPPGRVRLAPLYDTVPTMLFEHLAVRCAMEVDSVFESLEHVERDDLIDEVSGRHRWGVERDVATGWVDGWVDRIHRAADASDTPVAAYVRSRASRLAG